ncbi:MAG: CHRD domain-containing protein [Saccharospirillum sp.]|nr:CHRD domain-containing protein [Saccharospirillum sp.]
MKILMLGSWPTARLLLIVATAIGLFGCGNGNNGLGPDTKSYEVRLSGEQEVPMVDTEQSAMATVNINEADMTVTADMDLSNVTGVTAAHIHSGEVGTNGPVVFGFSDSNSNGVWTIESDDITQAQQDALLAGKWYINVHTGSFPDGELRGQVLTDTQMVKVFTLAGEQEVPPVNTNASGQGYLLYDSSNFMLTLNVWTEDITATAAHIHRAEAGRNGPVLLTLEEHADTAGLWQLPAESILSASSVSDLESANLYVNIHTAAHSGGEIRGQILPDDYALKLFDLSPGQEVPRVDSFASGHGYATFNTETGDLRLNAWASDMTTTAAHIHQAGIGENGTIVVGLEENTDHAGLWQTPASTMLNSTAQALLLDGGHYVNMHSAAFPDGQIRGQIVAAPWQVLAFPLSGSQEVPAVTTTAEGDGYALVNTESGDLTLVVNTRYLDDASAAHIHTGTAGMNGGVMIGLQQDGSDIAVWRVPNDTSLSDAELAEFLNAGHYVNVHTPTNSDGEIRGQVLTSAHVIFPLSLSGDHEVPPVVTVASGEGAFTLHTHTGSLRGAFTTSDIDSTAAHIHQAPAGENGSVILTLEATAAGYKVPDDTELSEAVTEIMLGEGHYVNVHSEAHPGGEIRAQITE